MLKKFKNSYSFIFALNCLRAFKDVRDKESEKEIFRELNLIQSIPLCSEKSNIFCRSGHKVDNSFQCAVSQKMISENLDKGLASMVMLARYGHKKPIIIPYPREWREHLQKIGIKQHSLSRITFIAVLFKKLQEAFSEVIALWQYSMTPAQSFKNYISFVGVPSNALETSRPGKKLDNFLSYAEQKFPQSSFIFTGDTFQKITERASINIYPFLPLKSFLQKVKFLGISFIKICISLVYGSVGKWCSLYMLKDEIISQYVKMLKDKDLPKKAIFLNSYYIYKPLWARILEQRGTEVSLFFYATNTFNIQFNKGDYGIFPGYQQMSWKKFYTLHKNHKKFIEETTKKSIWGEVEKQPVNMVDNRIPLELPAGPKIALFDVQPFRDSFLALIGRPTNLYKNDISQVIFKDVLEWCIQSKVFLIIKPKREVNKRLCPFYKKILEKTLAHERCIVLDSRYSPKIVCQNVDAVICQPFTSVALSAITMNKSVAYYDVTEMLKKSQPACQGVPLLHGKKELYEFLNASLKKR